MRAGVLSGGDGTVADWAIRGECHRDFAGGGTGRGCPFAHAERLADPDPAEFVKRDVLDETVQFVVSRHDHDARAVAEVVVENEKQDIAAGAYLTDGKNYLKFATNNGFLSLLDVQLEGKKRMKIEELLRGLRL